MSLEGTQKKGPKFLSGPHLMEKKEKKKVISSCDPEKSFQGN